jgi:TetR/AcrR family transcriptional regulator, transcriptional repressor for nem operon
MSLGLGFRSGKRAGILDYPVKKWHILRVSGRPRGFEPERVLAAAMDVFWTKGYEGTGVTDLEEATGLGRQSLYGAFGGKRTLFERVVDHYFAHVLEPGIVGVLDAPGSARANLERLFDAWLAMATAPDFRGCLIGNSQYAVRRGEPEFADVLRRKLKLVEDALVRTLRRAQQAREVRADLDVRGTARSLVAISEGLAMIGRVQRDRAFIRSVVDGARRLLD